MIRRVYVNQHGIITLDSDMFEGRKRISTGKKNDKRLVLWYKNNFDEEYKRLYDDKFKQEIEDYSTITLREYGKMVLELTSENRRAYIQKNALAIFECICNFQILAHKKFGEMKIVEIKSTNIMEWQKRCGYASKTIANHRAYLNMVMQTAMNDDIIRKNPISTVKLPPKVSVRKKIFFSVPDMKKLISTAKGQLKNYVQLACFTGMRGSELIALRWDGDIDFEKGIIRVDTGVVYGEENVTKSDTVRTIPMFKQARDALLSQQLKSESSEFVFINPQGNGYYSTGSMARTFKKLLAEAGIKDGTIHDLRRSFNTLLKQYGYPQDWILDVMGHVDDAVNRTHYTGRLDVDMDKIGNIAL